MYWGTAVYLNTSEVDRIVKFEIFSEFFKIRVKLYFSTGYENGTKLR